MSRLPPDVTLRRLGSADAKAAARLHASADPRPWPAADWAALIANPVSFGAAAELNRSLVGAVLARAAADEAEILMLVVAPDTRERGIGAALLEWTLDKAGERGAERVYLEVGTGNSGALALYRGYGFVDVGHRPGYYGPGASGDALILVRRPALDAPPTGS